MRSAVLVLVVAATWVRAASVHACSVAGPQPFEIDPAMSATDTVAPKLTGLSVTSIKRGKGSENTGCGSSGTSCDDLGWIAILPTATDDHTPTDQLGYSLSLARGELPEGLTLPTEAFELPAPGKEIRLSWLDGQTDDQEPFAFTLSVVVIDLAGNETFPMEIQVANGGNGGCSVGRFGYPNVAALTSAAFALAALTRRRARCRTRPV